MTLKKLWGFLQLFAGDGAGSGTGSTAADGGTGASASVDGSSDDVSVLRAAGVPESKIAKYGKAYMKRANRQTAPQQTAQQAAAATEETARTEEASQPKSFDWDEVMKDPECNRRMQETVQARTKKSKAAEAAMEALGPALKRLASENGLDPENIDYVALSKHLSGEYDDKALELGLPKETVARMEQQQRINAQTLDRQHIDGIFRQAEAMKTVFPNFDIIKELENPEFRRLTSRGVNVSVENAYYLVHRNELEAAQAQAVERKATQQVTNAIRAGQNRPDESGGSQAPSVTSIDWRHATPQQVKEFASYIRSEAAKGRKVYPG